MVRGAYVSDTHPERTLGEPINGGGQLMKPNRALAAVLALAAAGLVGAPTPGSAQAQQAERHCNTRVVGVQPDGDYILTPQECYATFDQAARAAGVRSSSRVTPTNLDAALSAPVNALVTYIAVHYDGTNYGGSSISIQGTGCSGGGINWATAQAGQWNNRFSSGRHYCQYGAYMRYYNSSNYDPSNAFFTPGWTDSPGLGGLNNLTSSTKYGGTA